MLVAWLSRPWQLCKRQFEVLLGKNSRSDSWLIAVVQPFLASRPPCPGRATLQMKVRALYWGSQSSSGRSPFKRGSFIQLFAWNLEIYLRAWTNSRWAQEPSFDTNTIRSKRRMVHSWNKGKSSPQWFILRGRHSGLTDETSDCPFYCGDSLIYSLASLFFLLSLANPLPIVLLDNESLPSSIVIVLYLIFLPVSHNPFLSFPISNFLRSFQNPQLTSTAGSRISRYLQSFQRPYVSILNPRNLADDLPETHIQ